MKLQIVSTYYYSQSLWKQKNIIVLVVVGTYPIYMICLDFWSEIRFVSTFFTKIGALSENHYHSELAKPWLFMSKGRDQAVRYSRGSRVARVQKSKYVACIQDQNRVEGLQTETPPSSGIEYEMGHGPLYRPVINRDTAGGHFCFQSWVIARYRSSAHHLSCCLSHSLFHPLSTSLSLFLCQQFFSVYSLDFWIKYPRVLLDIIAL